MIKLLFDRGVDQCVVCFEILRGVVYGLLIP